MIPPQIDYKACHAIRYFTSRTLAEPTLKSAQRQRALRKPFVAPIVSNDVASKQQMSAVSRS